MALDGNLISKGAGEGEAYMFQPFQVETHTIDQMNQNLVQQADRRIKEQQAKQAAEAQKKADFEKLLNDTYKYDPLDDVPIKKLHKEFTDLVANHKAGEDERPIKEAALALNIITNNSLNTFKKRGEIEKIRREQGDTNWFVGEDEYNAGALTPNEASDLGTAAQNLQAREMALDKFQVGAPKIKDIQTHIYKVAQTIPPEATETVTVKDNYGRFHDTTKNVYNEKALRDASDVDYQTHERDLKSQFPTSDDYFEAVKSTVKINEKEKITQESSGSATTGMAGEKNKKLNFTYTYGKNGEIIGVDPQTVGGTATKEYATTEIDGKPQKVRVEDTKNGKVTVSLPENEAIMNAYQKKRAEWGDRIKKKSAELNAKYKDKTDADKELALWAKSDKEPISPNLPTTMDLEGEQAEKVWHQAYGVTLDQAYTGNVPTFVREDKSLKGKNGEVKTTTYKYIGKDGKARVATVSDSELNDFLKAYPKAVKK